MGTDAGASANRFSGYFEHVEMTMMQEAGLTPAQVLRAATGEAARAMQVQGVGTIVPGAWADLVVLDRDPLQDISTRAASAPSGSPDGRSRFLLTARGLDCSIPMF